MSMWKKLENTFRSVTSGPVESSGPPQPKIALRSSPLTAQNFDLRQAYAQRAGASGHSSSAQSSRRHRTWSGAHVCCNTDIVVLMRDRYGSEGVELLLESIQKSDPILAAFCPSGLLCVSKTTVEIWNLSEDIIFPAEKSFTVPLSAAHHMPGSDFVYVGDEAGTVQIVNFSKPLSVAMYQITAANSGGYASRVASLGAVAQIQVHPISDQLLLIAYADGVIIEWDVMIRKTTRKLVVPLVPPPRPLSPPPPVPTGITAPSAAGAASAPVSASAAPPTPAASTPATTTPLTTPPPSPSSVAPPSPSVSRSASPSLPAAPKIPTVTCATYATDGERIVAGTSDGDLFWWRGALFVGKMRISEGDGPRRPVKKILCAKLNNDELTFVMGGTLNVRSESISLMKGSSGFAALSFATDEEVPIDFSVLFNGPHPSDSCPTHLLCITSKGQVIVEAFVHDPKGSYQLAILPTPASWLQFYPSAGLTTLELSSDFVINTLLLMLPDPTNVEATSRKVDKLWPVKGGTKPKLSSAELIFTGHQDGVVRLWSLEYSMCLMREFASVPKVAVTHLQVHERAKCLSVGFANGRYMLLSVGNIYRIADKPAPAAAHISSASPVALAAIQQTLPNVAIPPSPAPPSPTPSPDKRASPQRDQCSEQPQQRVLPEEIYLQGSLEGTVTLSAIAPSLYSVAFAALGGDVAVHDLCTGARILRQTFSGKVVSSILLANVPPPTPPPPPPVLGQQAVPLPAVSTEPRPHLIVAAATGDLYFLSLTGGSTSTARLPCAIVGLWLLNWCGEPIANCGPPLESQAQKHQQGINPCTVFLLACAETEVCLFLYPSLEPILKLELPFKTWKAQMVRRDVEWALSIAETSGKVHVITVPHLKLLARDLAVSMDLKFNDVYLFESNEAIGVSGSGTHVCLARAFFGSNEFCLPKGKVQVWQSVQWPDRSRGFFSSLLGGGDQRRAMKELFLRKADPPTPASAGATPTSELQKRREVRNQTNDVKNIMAQNVVKLSERGEKLNEMQLKSAELEDSSRDFAANVQALTQKLQKKAWYEP